MRQLCVVAIVPDSPSFKFFPGDIVIFKSQENSEHPFNGRIGVVDIGIPLSEDQNARSRVRFENGYIMSVKTKCLELVEQGNEGRRAGLH